MDRDPVMQGVKTPNQGMPPEDALSATTGVSDGVSNVASDSAENPVPTEDVTTPPATPTEDVTSDPTANPVASATAELATSRKPKRTGKIMATLLICLMVLAASCFVLWFFLVYKNPEKIVYDAINGLLHEKSVTLTGTMWSENDGNRTEVTLKNSLAQTSGTSDIVVKFGEVTNDHQIDVQNSAEFEVGSVALSDGVFYLRVGNFMDSVDQALHQEDMSYADLDDNSRMLYQLAEEIDNQWWEISVLDILDLLSEQLDDEEMTDQIDSARDFYRCMINVANQDYRGELAEIYRENRFIVISRVDQSRKGNKQAAAGNTLYELSFDYEKMADFLNALPRSDIAEYAYACVNDFAEQVGIINHSSQQIDAESFDKVNADDLEGSRHSELNQYYFEISNWEHRLEGIFVHAESVNGETLSELDLTLNYTPVVVAAPEDARPITDLLEDLIELVYASYDFDWDLDFDIDYDDDGDYENVGTFDDEEEIYCDRYQYNNDGTFDCLMLVDELEGWVNEEV